MNLEEIKERLLRYRRETLDLPDLRPAAVLVPLLKTPEGLEILFTVRSSQLQNHAGQISFPGGRLEPGESVEEAAVRETEEEIGLHVSPDLLLGRLDDQLSPAHYVVTPVVALVSWPQKLKCNPLEVEEVFTAPLAELKKVPPRSEHRETFGISRQIHYYRWDERLIWGMTGNVLKSLLETMEARR